MLVYLPPFTRDLSRLLLAATLLAALPVRTGFDDGPWIESAAAWAKNGGGGSSGSGSGSSGSHDDDDDHSGSNSGSGSSGSSGSGSSGSNSGSGGSGSSGSSQGSSSRSGSGKNDGQIARIVIRGDDISVEYADGWRENVAAGRYVLIDPRSRTVINRAATRADLVRLFDYVP